jgi:alpha(1,3/1,4) fucosyltransferase
VNLGFYNIYHKCNQNRIFGDPNADIGDDLFYASAYMGKTLREMGHRVATIDTAPLESFDAVVFCDCPNWISDVSNWRNAGFWTSYFRRLVKSDKPLYLVICECSAIWPSNWNRANHAPFKKVFTWSPELADGKKYIRMWMPFKLPEFAPYAPSSAAKFCCLIASQKYSWVPQELYSERVRAIRWFEKHHPDEFDLYGQRWDRFFFKNELSRLNPVLEQFYNYCPWLPRHRSFPSARGPIPSKRDVMGQYKFSICYENASYPGWFAEKMLDAMFAGSVPVYLGDPEVTKLVPKEAFIDKRDFPDYDALYRHLKGMSPAEYEGYRRAGHGFVHGEAIKVLSAKAFTDLLVREIINPQPAA